MKRARHMFEVVLRKGFALLCAVLFVFSALFAGLAICLCERTSEDCGRACHPVASSAARTVAGATACPHLAFAAPSVAPSPDAAVLAVCLAVLLPVCFAALLEAFRARLARPPIPCADAELRVRVFGASYAALRRRCLLRS